MRAIARKGKGLARYGAIISQDILSDFQSPSKNCNWNTNSIVNLVPGKALKRGVMIVIWQEQGETDLL